MENDEQIVEPQEPLEEIQEPQEDATTDDTPTVEDYQKLKKDLQTAIAQKKHYQEKLKKAETKTQETNTQTNTTVGLTRDEAILIAKGVDDRVIDEAKIIAEAKKIPLRDALEYPTIKSFQRDLEQEAKKQKAQLGASKGGGSNSSDDLTQKVGMTREEHKKALGF